jgi:hypothetical protein
MNASFGLSIFSFFVLNDSSLAKAGQGCDHLQPMFLDLASRFLMRSMARSSRSAVATAMWEVKRLGAL